MKFSASFGLEAAAFLGGGRGESLAMVGVREVVFFICAFTKVDSSRNLSVY